MTLRAVLLDVDFTLAKPGPDLGPEGYRRLGSRFGLELDPSRYADARREAVHTLQRHPELEHDEQMWVLFTERIIRGMGGGGESVHECAVEMTRAWEQAANFELYDDVLPTLDELRAHGLRLALVSNTGRNLDDFGAHHGIRVDFALASRDHGKTKPHRSIFEAVLAGLGVSPKEAAMVGDTPEDDIDGARALGMQAFLLDREGDYADRPDRLTDLRQLPAALGLEPIPPD